MGRKAEFLEDAKKDLDEFMKFAGSFREPGAFTEPLERLRAGITQDALFNWPEYKPLKDAWFAALFSLGYQEWGRVLTEVLLCDPKNEFPDFQVRIRGQVFDFEATMAMRPGRLLGLLYKGTRVLGPPAWKRPESLPEFDPRPFQDAIRKKATKHYSPKPHLLVYLSLLGKDVSDEVIRKAARIKEAEHFRSIWVVGGGTYYLMCAKRSDELPAFDGWFKIPVLPAGDATLAP